MITEKCTLVFYDDFLSFWQLDTASSNSQFMGLRLYLKDLADCRKLAHSQVDQLRLQGQLDLLGGGVHIHNARPHLLMFAVLLLPITSWTNLKCKGNQSSTSINMCFGVLRGNWTQQTRRSVQ